MGDKIANKKKQAKRSAKPTLKAPMTVAEIKTATPRK
ncbi:MAG: malic enzyme [Sulfitobacter sp.]|nr:malic enzyme [Sulfitobacter sp.]